MGVLDAMRRANPQLNQDLRSAQSIGDVQIAFKSYFSRIKIAVGENIPVDPDDQEEDAVKKRILIDLLLSIGTQ